jgi:DnaJ-class molecular chaperone
MDVFVWILLLVVALLVIYFVMGRGRRVATMICTRCEGTGQVNERWPDPSEPTGWHRVEGICPKCKGKGKV